MMIVKLKDTLEDIFEHQSTLQAKMPIDSSRPESFPMEKRQAFINEMGMALLIEVGEALQSTQWKNPNIVKFGWKKTQQFNEEHFKEELVDCMHFLVNLALASGMDAKEFHARYIGKNEVNTKRQEDKY